MFLFSSTLSGHILGLCQSQRVLTRPASTFGGVQCIFNAGGIVIYSFDPKVLDGEDGPAAIRNASSAHHWVLSPFPLPQQPRSFTNADVIGCLLSDLLFLVGSLEKGH